MKCNYIKIDDEKEFPPFISIPVWRPRSKLPKIIWTKSETKLVKLFDSLCQKEIINFVDENFPISNFFVIDKIPTKNKTLNQEFKIRWRAKISHLIYFFKYALGKGYFKFDETLMFNYIRMIFFRNSGGSYSINELKKAYNNLIENYGEIDVTRSIISFKKNKKTKRKDTNIYVILETLLDTASTDSYLILD
ncbi:MAG: hypothetical protein JST55_16320 [Bacteroidetes bacterium]|nr:hypothetical protein [Bacteroidota bacterium]